MHLISIKIAGFKSFADAVTFHIPQTLSGIVGPNGSGKSNIIDAMRWVIGESSAKSLRGGTLDDVIFSGSSLRKPAGQASVELLFDNTLSRCSGQWEKYAQISIRRTVTRDGVSEYFINGTRARRRDVKELFLGTGFGPRSYSIIEQGMISRIVEGKPEELSAFVEEVSGVSKFREKRHETLLKMNRVNDNLERLNDMRYEIDRRIRQLKYQADQARRYTKLKEKLQNIKTRLLAYEWAELNANITELQRANAKLDLTVEQRTATVRALEADLEQIRKQRLDLETQLTDIQMELFQVDAEIADCDRRIEARRQDLEHTRAQMQIKKLQIQDSDSAIAEHRAKERTAVTEGERVQRVLRDAAKVLQDQQADLGRCEQRQLVCQADSEKLDQQVIEAVRRRESVSAALDENSRRALATAAEIERVGTQIAGLKSAVERDLSESPDERLEAVVGACDTARTDINRLEAELSARRTQVDEYVLELEELKDSARSTQVELGALQRVLAAAATDVDEDFADWLEENELKSADKLHARVNVSDGWERAVDRVLGDKLSAICVDDVAAVARTINGRKFAARYFFVDGRKADATNGELSKLARFVHSPDRAAESMLAGFFTADSLESALAMQPGLAASECVATHDGALVGMNWYSPALADEHTAGVLETANRAAELDRKVSEFNAAEQTRKALLDETRSAVARLEQQLRDKRGHLNSLNDELERIRTKQSAFESRRQQNLARLNEAHAKEQQLSDTRSTLASGQQELKANLTQESDALMQIEQRRFKQLTELKSQNESLKELQHEVNRSVRHCHQLELDAQKYDSEQQLAAAALADLNQRRAECSVEYEALKVKLQTVQDPDESLKTDLGRFMDEKKAVQARLLSVREAVDEVESARQRLEDKRLQNQLAVEEANFNLQQENITLGTLRGQADEVRHKISELNADVDEVLESLDDQFDYEDTLSKCQRLEKRIAGTGSVNLVAVDQYEQELERKTYMDFQYDDLTRAMETLQQTIKKIDKESQERYNETFSIVNSEYQRLVPKLFGGGSGHLELLGEYPENAGIRIFARPKGKRIHNIQALSGGEKALTAVALILSFFQLNPSPVCLLDEIDAPLDDDNVYRLCSALNELANTTQLILITHNKITMESVDTLIGVTMPEPNVSKILSVNLLEAQEFAA